LFWGKYAIMAELGAEGNWHDTTLDLLRQEGKGFCEPH
jgi:hypothetical protein